MRRLLLVLGVMCAAGIFCVASVLAAGKDLGAIGAHAQWARIEIILPGPMADGGGNPNPFDIPVDVLFVGPSGQTYQVPAFYDGDGAGGIAGNIWKVRFSADEPGLWSFSSTSQNVQLDGYSGTLTVTAVAPDAKGFYRWGRLEYTGTAENRIRYMKFRDGPYWLKAGCDDPENFLGGFSNYSTLAQRKAAIAYLAGKGINSMYMMSHNIDGDDHDVWPWLGSTVGEAKANGGSSARFDVVKLDQWLDLFEFMMEQGVALYLVLEDDSAWTGYNHPRYFREIVARFGHLPALLFNLGEEYNEKNSLAQGIAWAQVLQDTDPYKHSIALHNQNEPSSDYLDAAQFSATAIQTDFTDPLEHNRLAIDWIRQAMARNVRVPMVGFDEPRPLLDRRGWWSGYMGGAVWEGHVDKPYDRVMATWARAWTELGGARTFMESVPFWEMEPDNALVAAGNAFVLARPGAAYAVYLPVGGTVSVALAAGITYTYRWWNPANGVDGSFVNGGTVNGGVQSFTAPGAGDWALQILAAGIAVNTPPQVFETSLTVQPGNTVLLSFPYTDQDGPGPYLVTLTRQPVKGTLTETGQGWEYRPNPDATGSDSIGWKVSDGVDVSEEANLTLSLVSGNLEPSVRNQSFFMEANSSLGVPLDWSDPDSGPGPYAFTVVAQPTHGTLEAVAGGGNDYRYTPLAGFSGVDQFTWRVNDGLADSASAQVVITVSPADVIPPPDVSGGALFSDFFNRPDSSVLGNGWTETETTGASIDLAGGRLVMSECSDLVRQPMAVHTFPFQDKGQLVWEFTFDWQRTGNEGTYRVFMQLGDSALMQSSTAETGVGVNLVWTKSGTTHEILVAVAGASSSPLVALSGPADISVHVDLDLHQYQVSVNGEVVGSALPFANNVGLDAVRFFADAVNERNFNGRSFDDVAVHSLSAIPVEINNAPVALDQAVSTVLDTARAVTLGYSDSDGPGPYQFHLVSLPGHGQISSNDGDAQLIYTPQLGYTGGDSFTFRVNDGAADSSPGRVDIQVQAVNAPPVITSLPVVSAQVGAQYHYQVTAVDDQMGLTFFLLTAPSGMTMDSASGVIGWLPSAGQEGSQEVTVEARDSGNLATQQSFSVEVAPAPPPLNIAPVAQDQVVGTSMDTAVSVTLGYTDSDGPGPYQFTLESMPGHGQLGSIDANAQVIYTPQSGYTGGDSFTFRVNDGDADSSPGSVDIQVQTVNTPPVITSLPVVSAQVGEQYHYQVTAADAGDVVTFVLLTAPGGMTMDSASGLIDWIPSAGQEGSQEVAVEARDSGNLATQQSFTVEVAPAPPPLNIAPVALGQTVSTMKNTAVPIALGYTDGDGPGPYQFAIVSQPIHGTVEAVTSGGNDYLYTPLAGFSGTDQFVWRVNDGQADSNSAQVVIEVKPAIVVPEVPGGGALLNDSFDRPDSAILGNGWIETETTGGNIDLVGGRLVMSECSDLVRQPMAVHPFPLQETGQLVWDFTFDWQRTGSEGTYRVFMQLGDSALMSSGNADKGTAVNLAWTKSGTTHEILVALAGTVSTPLVYISGPTDISVHVDLDLHQYQVSVNGEVVGSALPFANNVGINAVRFFTDALNEKNFSGHSFDDVAVHSLSAIPVEINSAPVALDQAVSTVLDTALAVTLGYSDSDGPGPYQFHLVSLPGHGQISSNDGDAQLIYTPQLGYTGGDSFTFRVNDGAADSSPGRVDIQVQAVNAPPVITSLPVVSAQVGAQYHYQVTAVDAVDVVTFVLLTAPSGMTMDSASGVIGWLPSAGQEGSQEVTVEARDSGNLATQQSFSVEVAPAPPPLNIAPVALGQAVSTTMDTAVSITLGYSDSDGPGPYQFTLVSMPGHGQLGSIDANAQVIYTPQSGYTGGDSFTFRVNDGDADSSPGSVDIQVQTVNTPPVITSLPVVSAQVGEQYHYQVTAADAGDVVTFSLAVAPVGMTIDGNGVIRWRPEIIQEGQHAVTVEVSDSIGHTGQQNFVVVATQADLPADGLLAEGLPANVVGWQSSSALPSFEDFGNYVDYYQPNALSLKLHSYYLPDGLNDPIKRSDLHTVLDEMKLRSGIVSLLYSITDVTHQGSLPSSASDWQEQRDLYSNVFTEFPDVVAVVIDWYYSARPSSGQMKQFIETMVAELKPVFETYHKTLIFRFYRFGTYEAFQDIAEDWVGYFHKEPGFGQSDFGIFTGHSEIPRQFGTNRLILAEMDMEGGSWGRGRITWIPLPLLRKARSFFNEWGVRGVFQNMNYTTPNDGGGLYYGNGSPDFHEINTLLFTRIMEDKGLTLTDQELFDEFLALRFGFPPESLLSEIVGRALARSYFILVKAGWTEPLVGTPITDPDNQWGAINIKAGTMTEARARYILQEKEDSWQMAEQSLGELLSVRDQMSSDAWSKIESKFMITYLISKSARFEAEIRVELARANEAGRTPNWATIRYAVEQLKEMRRDYEACDAASPAYNGGKYVAAGAVINEIEPQIPSGTVGELAQDLYLSQQKWIQTGPGELTMSWQTPVPGRSYVEYAKDDVGWIANLTYQATTMSPASTTQHHLVVGDLQPLTTYFFRLATVTDSGEKATSSEYHVTLLDQSTMVAAEAPNVGSAP